MIRVNGTLKDLMRGREEGTWVVSFTTHTDFREAFDDLNGKELVVEMKKSSKRRSLDANAMAWAIINQIAAKLQEKEPRHGWTATEVYRNAIREVAGACSVHCMPNDQIDQFIEDWESLGTGFQVETFPSQIPGCTNGRFWKGSHMYNTQQMSTLINGLIQDAEALGIPTLTDREAEKLLANWKERYDRKHTPTGS